MKNVLIVDDHPVARLAVKMQLEKDDMMVIGETDDSLEAALLAKKLAPDLILYSLTERYRCRPAPTQQWLRR